MKSHLNHAVVAWLCIVMVFGAVACTIKPKLPIYLEAGFNAQAVGPILMLPPVDARIDKKIEVNFDKQLRDEATKLVAKKGYQIAASPTTDGPADITEDELRTADGEWIKRLGPPEARWVMIVSLIDVTTNLTFGSTGNAEVEGFLYDKEQGTLVWRDKGIGQVGQGGLLGMALISMMDDEAISCALSKLFESLPAASDEYKPGRRSKKT